jgi:malate permease and related proteins
LLDALIQALALLALGVVGRRTGWLDPAIASALNRFVIALALPALVLTVLPGVAVDRTLLTAALIAHLGALVIGGAVWMIGGWLGFDRPTRICVTALSAVGNTAFLGYPLARALLPDEALPAAIVFDQLGSFVLLAVAVPWLIGGASAPIDALKRVLGFPPLLAVFAALLLPVPSGAVRGVLELLAATVVPLTLLSVGLSVEFRLARDEFTPLLLGLSAKLIGFPLLAFGLAWLFALSGPARAAVTLQAAMPAMVSAAALLIAAELKPRLAAALVGAGVLLIAVATLALATLAPP